MGPHLLLGWESPCPCPKAESSPGLGTTRGDLLGDDFTRNADLSPGDLFKQHFTETGSLLPKKKRFGFAELTQENMLSKKLPKRSAGNVLFAISPQGWSAGVLKCYYSPGNCESASPHPQQILVGRALKSLETLQLLPCGVSINPLTLISDLVKCRIWRISIGFCSF